MKLVPVVAGAVASYHVGPETLAMYECPVALVPICNYYFIREFVVAVIAQGADSHLNLFSASAKGPAPHVTHSTNPLPTSRHATCLLHTGGMAFASAVIVLLPY